MTNLFQLSTTDYSSRQPYTFNFDLLPVGEGGTGSTGFSVERGVGRALTGIPASLQPTLNRKQSVPSTGDCGSERDSACEHGGLPVRAPAVPPKAELVNTRISESLHLCRGRLKQLPRYVRACQNQTWSLVLWKKDNPKERKILPYRCRSWRCVENCARRNQRATREERSKCRCCACQNAATYFARLKTSFDRSPEWWCFAVYTLDQERFRIKHSQKCKNCAKSFSEECCINSAYRGILERLRTHVMWLRRRYGVDAYVTVVEQHRTGWPHVHMAIKSKSLYSKTLDGEDARLEWARHIKKSAVRCGLGYIGSVQAARNNDAVAGYITKVSGVACELLDATEKEQLPLAAPRHFRRVRASRGFLVPKIKDETVTGELVQRPAHEVQNAFDLAILRRAERASVVKTHMVQSYLTDNETGEVFQQEKLEKPICMLDNGYMNYTCYRCGTDYAEQMERCWAGCGETGFIGPASFRAANAVRPKRSGMTAFDLASTDQKVWHLPSVPGLILPKVGLVLVEGKAGHGKSTFTLGCLRDLLPAVMFAFEEGLSGKLGDKLRRLEFRSQELWIEAPSSVQDVYGIIAERRPKAVSIDSISMSTFTAQDLISMVEAFKCLVFAVVHQTKAGLMAGEGGLPYVSDVIIEVEEGRWKTTKSRAQALTSGTVEGVTYGQPSLVGGAQADVHVLPS